MFGWFLVVRKGDSGKAETPSGRLVLATRHVDLKAASTRAPLALCADDMTITKRGKNRTRWWFEFNLNLKERLDPDVQVVTLPNPLRLACCAMPVTDNSTEEQKSTSL